MNGKDCPAFFVAIAASLGCALFFSFSLALLIIALVLISFSEKRWLLLGTVLLFYGLTHRLTYTAMGILAAVVMR